MHISVAAETVLGRIVVVTGLEWAGYQKIHVCSSGKSLLNDFGKHPTDLVIIDKKLPAMSGVDVARALPERQGMHFLPILMLGADFTTDEAVEAAHAGITELLTKPITPQKLHHKIAAAHRYAC